MNAKVKIISYSISYEPWRQS